jgi:hypothetical protein
MTIWQEETWADDANAFIRDEETDLEAYTARVGALDLISVCDSNKVGNSEANLLHHDRISLAWSGFQL